MRQHRFVIAAWGAVLLLVSSGCLVSSLFGRLGYAFGFVITVPLVPAALHLGVRAGQSAGGRAFVALRAGLFALVPVLAAPLLVMAASAPFSPSCGLASGLAWYVLQPLCSSLVGLTVGISAVRITKRAGLALGLAFGLALLSAAVALAWIYFFLPVFVYDPFWGFFPGSLYDEQVGISAVFLWARLYHLLGALTLLFAVSAFRSGRLWGVACVLGAAAIALGANGDRFGFRRTTEGIIKALGGRRDTLHFTLYFHAATPVAVLDRLARECEFRYAGLVEMLGRGPSHITIFFFDSSEDKQLFTGLRGTSVARPWQRQIVTHGLAMPHDSLNHELVHAFFGDYGDPHFGLPLRGLQVATGLVEGVAVALDEDDSDEEVHGLAQTMQAAHLLPPLEELMSLRFLLHPPQRAYFAAGSFCRFLVARYGGAKLPLLYAAGGEEASWPRLFGVSLHQLERDWWKYLEERPSPKMTAESKEALQRPSIFSRRCSHELATKRAEAFSVMSRDVDGGLRLLQALCSEDPDRPEHLSLLLREAMARKRLRLAEQVAKQLLSHPQAGQKGQAQASEAIGDLAILAGDRAAARDWFVRASRVSAEPSLGRLRCVKQHAASLPAGDLADTLVKYLYEDAQKPERASRLVASAPEVGLYHYLLARQRAASHNPVVGRTVLSTIDRALALGLPDERFVKEALLVGIAVALEIPAYREAKRFGEALVKAGDPSATVWVRRIDYLARVDNSPANH